MKTTMNSICYLCGKKILDSELKNKDHVFPQQFINRKHPKTKGFDYMGVLPTHKKCNSKFGESKSDSESIVKISLKLINVLFNSDSHIIRQHKKKPEINILAINAEYLKDFSNKVLEFFKIRDVRNIEYNKLRSIEFLQNQNPIKPFDKSVDICLSVLAKSASAILIQKFSISIPSHWIITAYPGYCKEIDIDFDSQFGATKPLEDGIKFWAKDLNLVNYICVYKFESIVVFFHFSLDSGQILDQVLPKIFDNKDILIYRSENLLNLIGYNWSQNFL